MNVFISSKKTLFEDPSLQLSA